MAPRRPAPASAAPVAAPAAIVASGPNFLDLSFYSGGFLLPKGRWCMFFDVVMHTPMNNQGIAVGKPRLGVMTACYNLDKLGEEPVEQFFSMGSKADQSFAPNETGKGLTPIPGAPSSTAPRNTNWQLFLKSLYDCGLPQGLVSNDITPLDGIWLVTDQVPEPEERKQYAAQAATGEAAADPKEERKGNGLTVIAVEIIDGGKPWEGGGGVPATAAPVAAARPAAAPARPVAAPPTRPAPVAAAAAPVAEATSTDDMEAAVINGISSVLEAEPNGTTKLKARTGTFKYLNANGQAGIATQALNTYFGNDETLNTVLGALGYVISGANIVPAQ